MEINVFAKFTISKLYYQYCFMYNHLGVIRLSNYDKHYCSFDKDEK